jgi:hypothetical protein
MSAPLFKHKPERGSFGHSLARGSSRLSGGSCICAPMPEAAVEPQKITVKGALRASRVMPCGHP